MTGAFEYQTEGMQRTAAHVDGQVEPLLSRAEDRVMDAARHQDERKWGTEDLGAPITFGHMYERRLRQLEDQIRKLVQATSDFSQKVSLAATRANATEEEITQIFSSQDQLLDAQERTPATGNHTAHGPAQITPLG